jgi:hypothetical protein
LGVRAEERRVRSTQSSTPPAGLSVCLALTEGQTHQMTVAPLLLSGIRHAYVIGERRYDAKLVTDFFAVVCLAAALMWLL